VASAPPQPPSPAPAAEKPAAEPDPRIQAEADMRSARDLIAQGRRAEAEPLLKQALARAPALTDAAMTLARLQVDRGDLSGAWETLQRSLPFAQQQAAYQAFCGTVLQRLNRSREAVDHYQAALRLNPAEGRWWIGLGLALEGAGKTAEAREAFQRGRASGNLPPEMAAFAEQKSR
jgi:MSHA biogenesis protein MshN